MNVKEILANIYNVIEDSTITNKHTHTHIQIER